MFPPMAWYYFVGGVRAAFKVYGEFNRTPKGEGEKAARQPRINLYLLIGEVFTFLYSALALYVAIRMGNYLLVPLNATVCVGFGMVLYWSFQERRARGRS
jgi:cellulose synthase (UDP-forming)